MRINISGDQGQHWGAMSLLQLEAGLLECDDCFDHCGDTGDSSQELKNFVSLTGDIYQTVGDEFVAEI